MLPANFQERIVRVYSRSSDPAKLSAIQVAFRSYLRKFGECNRCNAFCWRAL